MPAQPPALRLEELPFDQHERYRVLAAVAARCRDLAGGGPLKVLDVGGLSSSRTGEPFLPAPAFLGAGRVVVCDLPHADLPGYLCASGACLPFADGSFDLAFSTDVLEHVPPADRGAFVQELARVARVVVLGGPFRSPEVEEAEARVRALAGSALRASVPPLEEHARHGLPELDATLGALRASGMAVGERPHGRLDLWLCMYRVRLALSALVGGTDPVAALDRWYNATVSPDPKGAPAYRRLVVAVRPDLEAELPGLLDAALSGPSGPAGEAALLGMGAAWLESALEGRRELETAVGQLERSALALLDASAAAGPPGGAGDAPPHIPEYGPDAGDPERYAEWVAEGMRAAPGERRRLAELVAAMVDPPTISVLVPVYRPPLASFERCVDSVRQQVYPHWELCLCDDASGDPELARIMDRVATSDRRIKLARHAANGGIGAATNSALDLATGDFVAFLDNDDELAPEALAEVALAIAADPTVDVVYTDEDKIDLDGRRFGPFFKPDWSPDYLLSCMYVAHLTAIRRSLVEEVGGLATDLDGSQDHDLLLRTSERARTIHHIPKVLYHWRAVEGSVADTGANKGWAHEAGFVAVQRALDRRGEDAIVLPGPFPGGRRVQRRVRGEPLVSIVIPFRDGADMLQRCLASIHSTAGYDRWEALLVDNQSWEPETRALLDRLQEDPRCRILEHREEFNWAAINNRAAAEARGEVLLFLNNDVEGTAEGWLTAMLEHAQRPEVGVVGARLVYPTGHLQHAGVIIGMGGIAGHAFRFCPPGHLTYFSMDRLIRNYSAVTGACMMVRRDVFDEVEGFDEFFHVAYNDIDFCLRVRERDYLVVYQPHATLVHYEAFTRGESTDKPEIAEMLRRWLKLIQDGDPYYNRNLSMWRHEFTLPAPGEKPPWKALLKMLDG